MTKTHTRYRIARFVAGARESVRDHAHRSPHLFFLESGSMTEDDGHHGVEMRPGTIRASTGGQCHAIDFGESGARCVSLHFFDHDMAGHIMRHAAGGNFFANVKGLDHLGRALINHASVPQTALLAELDFYQLMATMAAGETHDPPPWLEEAKKCLMEVGAPPPPVETVARQVGVSREHLTRRYRKAYGVAPARARTVSALTTAMCLMASDDMSLADVAGEAGFYDQSHFSNAMRSETGRSPLEMQTDIADRSHFSKTLAIGH